MSFDYSKPATTALNLLVKFGGSITLSRKAGDSIDPITGVTVVGTDASVITTGLLTDYENSMVDGARILEGDRKLILSNEHEPLPSDKPVIDGEEWAIESIKSIKPFDVVVIYFVQVRK